MASIYGLIDPRDNSLKYIGYTSKTLLERLSCHFKDRISKDGYKDRWIRSLWSNHGLKPEIVLIEDILENEWEEAEIFWIEYFKFIGCKLTNTAIGGMGRKAGTKLTEEHKKKISIGVQKAMEEGRFNPKGSPLGNKAWNQGLKMKYKPRKGKTAKGVLRPWQDGKKISENRRKPFSIQNKITGEIVIDKGINLFCIDRGLNTSNMAALISGKINRCKGWVRYEP